MSLQSKKSLHEKLANDNYRDAFVASRIAQTLAFQLRVLRQRAELSQDGLAAELRTSQNAISRMENPKYGKPSISTLLKIASFFKVGLIVRFAPLSEIVDWTMSLSSRSVDVPDLGHDTGLIERKPIKPAMSSTADDPLWEELPVALAGGVDRTIELTETVRRQGPSGPPQTAASNVIMFPGLQGATDYSSMGGSTYA